MQCLELSVKLVLENITTDAQILNYARTKEIGAIHHATSTCRIGRANNSMAVVDSHGKVFGVQKLRVIDSSSFVFNPPVHTQGATYAHAEKLVDDIIKDIERAKATRVRIISCCLGIKSLIASNGSIRL